ncbi:tetratricopeptide repeat protein [Bacteroidota bacterium]
MKSDKDFLDKSYHRENGFLHRCRSIFYGIIPMPVIVIMVFCLVQHPIVSHAQSPIDSLLNIVDTSQGIEKINIYNQLSYEYSFTSIKDAKNYAELAKDLADSLRYKPGKARSLQQLGLIAYLEGDFLNAENLCVNALDIALEINDLRTTSECYKTLGIIYEESNALNKSLENYEKAHEIELTIGNSVNIAQSSINLGMICRKQYEWSKAEQHISKAWEIYSNLEDIQGMANAIAESGKLYLEMNNLDTTRTLLFQADSITKRAFNDYLTLKVNKYFIEYYRKAGIPDSAVYFGIKALDITKAVKDPIEAQSVLLNLSEDYAASGNYEEARKYHQQYSLLRDSLFNDEDSPAVMDSSRFIADQASLDEKSSDHKIDIWSEYYIWILIISGGLLVGIILIFLYKRYSDKSSDIKIIEEQKGQLLELSNQLEKKEEAIKQLMDKNQRLRNQNQTLRVLFSEDEYKPERIESRIHELTRIIAENLDADRAGLWKFVENYNKMEALDQYIKVKDQHTSGEIIDTSRYPLYFEALKNSVSIQAFNVAEDSRTAEFNQDRNLRFEIKSRLDVPIIFRGNLTGVIWTEYTSDYREFQAEDEGFLISTASMAGELLVKQKRSDHRHAPEDEVQTTQTEQEGGHYTRLKGIMASLNTAVFVLDSNLNIVLFNPGAEDRFGYSSNEMLTKNVSVILDGGNNNPFNIELEEYLSSDKKYLKDHQPIEFINSEGTTFKTISGISMVNIGEEDYITCILLKDDIDDFSDIQSSGNVYDYFILDHDELIREPLNNVLNEAVDKLNSEISDDVILHYTDNQLPATNIYRNKLMDAIKMVFKNALNSIGENGDIYIQSEINDDQIHISIADTGEGLSNEKRKKSFDPFVMYVDTAQLRGMGLVRWIIELHGGKVKINSRLGKGTEVIMIIPVVGS